MDKEFLKKLYRYCSSAEKCRSDIEKYLYNYNLEENEILDLIKNLEDNNFINEERYAYAFANDKLKINKWGKIKIAYELKSKNINSKTINNAINAIDETEYYEILMSALKGKSAIINKKDKEMQKNSLIKFALSRGFEFEFIKKAVKQLFKTQ